MPLGRGGHLLLLLLLVLVLLLELVGEHRLVVLKVLLLLGHELCVLRIHDMLRLLHVLLGLRRVHAVGLAVVHQLAGVPAGEEGVGGGGGRE
jgi:hypothetical protein